MKKWIFTIFVIFFIVPTLSATEADFYVINVSPTQIAPGETSTLNITLKNLGTRFASRIEASLDPEDTSPVDPIGAGRVQIREAKEAQTTTYFGVVKQFEEIKLSFDFSVDPSAAEKTYFVPLVLKWDASEVTKKTQTLQLGIRVKERNADFQVVRVVPETLTEGETTVLTITLKNSGDNYAYDLKANLDAGDTSPIDPIGPTRLEFEDEMVLPGEEVELQYPVNVKQNTTEKVYYVPLDLEWEDDTSKTKSQSIKVGFFVKGSQSAIEVGHEAPDMITPGDEFNISLILKNTGGTAKNIDIIIDEGGASLLSKSPNNIHLEELSSGGTKRIDMMFISSKDLATGLYSIPITLKYVGLDGQLKSQKERVPIEVKGLAKLNIASLKIEPQNPKKGDEVTIELRVENVGDADAENTKLVLDSELEGFKTAYLGELEKDDDTPAIFTLRAAVAGEAVNTLTLTYEDDFGENIVSEEIRFNISDNQTQNLGTILVVLLAAAALLIYLAAKKRKG